MEMLDDEESLLSWMAYTMIAFAIATVLLLQLVKAPYGRYSSSSWGPLINAKVAWFVQELPSFTVPVMLVFFSDTPLLSNTTNRTLMAMFLVHYFQRAFIYPYLIRGGHPTPAVPFLAALGFCLYNGYMQGISLCRHSHYPPDWMNDPRFVLGIVLFFTGMITNWHSDHILRTLRKPGEEKIYKIPRGGMFEHVSGANMFSETLEWFGFALACWSLPAFAFFIFTICNVGPRAVAHHRWYLEKFADDYPRNRKAFIPFLL